VSYLIREMTIEDYEQAYQLWNDTDGIGLSDADSRENIMAYIIRNPGLSYVAVDQDQIIGTGLCGHDGRRGYLHHIVVHQNYQKQDIGRALVEICVKGLQKIGIKKCHIFVYRNNDEGKTFWEHLGWKIRHELDIMSLDI